MKPTPTHVIYLTALEAEIDNFLRTDPSLAKLEAELRDKISQRMYAFCRDQSKRAFYEGGRRACDMLQESFNRLGDDIFDMFTHDGFDWDDL